MRCPLLWEPSRLRKTGKKKQIRKMRKPKKVAVPILEKICYTVPNRREGGSAHEINLCRLRKTGKKKQIRKMRKPKKVAVPILEKICYTVPNRREGGSAHEINLCDRKE